MGPEAPIARARLETTGVGRVACRGRIRTLVLLALLALVVAACGATAEDRTSGETRDRERHTAETDDDSSGRSETRADDALAAESPASGESTAAAPPSSTAATDATDPTVTAGSVDDNALWDEYLLYRQGFDALGIPISPIRVEGRQVLRVIDEGGSPVLGAELRVSDPSGVEVARLHTYADGRALFHPESTVEPDTQSRTAYRVVATKGGVTTEVELASGQNEHTVVLEGASRGAPRVDVLFLIDATGSMSDEIERLKANMISVAERIAELPGQPDARFALTVYRDRGDEYVTRTVDFTGDVEAFSEALAAVVADGGGDLPEALGAGLSEAVTIPTWRGDDTVKLVFLLGDAAPHLAGAPGYEDEPDYAEAATAAAAQGIKILPVASSGLDDQGEYVFRQLAQVTLGRFVFLTYGPDGSAPGSTTPHSVDPEDYDVLALDELVVRLVGDELAQLA